MRLARGRRPRRLHSEERPEDASPVDCLAAFHLDHPSVMTEAERVRLASPVGEARSPQLRLVAVGDLQLGDSPSCVGFGFRSRYAQGGLAAALDQLRPVFTAADVVFGNLETPLSNHGLVSGHWDRLQLRGPPEYARDLRAAGITVLNFANNHAAQHGPEAFQETRAALTDAGIACCGIRGEVPWASEPVVLSPPGGIRIGVLGYSLRPRQYDNLVPPYAEGSSEVMAADVGRLRSTVDSVIVSLHWGEEFVDQPSVSEVNLGRSLVEAGATLILGHHPHVVRPVEQYGDGMIAYSLGNLIGDMIWYAPFRRGAVLRCTLTREGVSEAIVDSTYLDDEFRARLAGPGGEIQTGTIGMPEAEYAAAVKRTVHEQRISSYAYALRNLGKYPPSLLAQLAGRTIRNKIGALLKEL